MKQAFARQILGPPPPLDVTPLPYENVAMIRGDRVHPSLSGNKWYKLLPVLRSIATCPVPPQVFSFGGFWSNHLHALAFASDQLGFSLTGFIRGHPDQAWSDTLRDAVGWGMTPIFLSREDYRRRHDPDWCLARARASLEVLGVAPREQTIRIIPEGGSDESALSGLALWAEQIEGISPGGGTLILAVGSGGTLAGLRKALSNAWQVIGIPVVREGVSLDARIRALMGPGFDGRWQLWRGYEGGGFGRLTAHQAREILALEQRYQIPLDPVYTGKVMLAVDQALKSGRLNGPVWVLHTGGLQGRRGFQWPADGEIPGTIGYS